MEWENGPDEIYPADDLVTWIREKGVKLRMAEAGPLSATPVSVMTALERTVKQYGSRNALATKVDGEWAYLTYQEYYDNVRTAARAFIKLGLEPHHGVGIIGFNAPEWHIADLAAIFAGGFATGIYTTNSPDACQFVAENAECNIVVVENDVQLQKFLQVRDRLPHLKAIVQYKGQPKESYPNVYSWQQLMALGTDDLDTELQSRIKSQAPNKCCTIIYTSGTTGTPKGVMLSHDNMTWMASAIVQRLRLEPDNHHVISYLPLSHQAAQIQDIYAPIFIGATVYFAQPDALKGTLGATLKEVRPTIFLGMPRVWEKMQESIMNALKANGFVKRSMFNLARTVGRQKSISSINGDSGRTFGFALANRFIFEKLRVALGLDRCRFLVSGAAPISKDTLDFFFSLNMPIMEVYGMSECSGPHTFASPWDFKLTSVGKELPGTSTRLIDIDKDGNGEICMGGRHVFMGYLNLEDKTREAVDNQGWLHSGDIGNIDEDGFLYITGRIKELLITAGGENIPPVPIEDRVKEALPCISNCMLIGDRRKFLSMLITLKTGLDRETGEPLDELAPAALDWCRSVGSDVVSVTGIVQTKDGAVLRAIQKGIDAVNRQSTSRAQTIQKWSIVPRDFSIHGGELGPTLKMRRQVICEMYQREIEAFYADKSE